MSASETMAIAADQKAQVLAKQEREKQEAERERAASQAQDSYTLAWKAQQAEVSMLRQAMLVITSNVRVVKAEVSLCLLLRTAGHSLLELCQVQASKHLSQFVFCNRLCGVGKAQYNCPDRATRTTCHCILPL